MVPAGRVAIIGDGVVAGFAAMAVEDAGWKATVMSQVGSFTPPPAGAFYFHDLPPRLKSRYKPETSVTTVLGDDPGAYSRKMWGKTLPTSQDKFVGGGFDVSHAYSFRLEMLRTMFAKADVLITGRVTADQVREHAEKFDRVVVTVPISFTNESPVLAKFHTVRAARNKFFDALCETPETVDQRYQSGLLTTFARGQSFRHHLDAVLSQHKPCVVTIYTAHEDHLWLRATYHPATGRYDEPTMDLELPESMFTMPHWRAWAKRIGWTEGKLWRLFHEIRTALKWAGRDMKTVRKIHPESQVLNQAPAENVLLTGRWATWRRGELSHETYDAVKGWLE